MTRGPMTQPMNADQPLSPDEVGELRAKLEVLGPMLPLRRVETADYAEMHAANSNGGQALAITVQPSLIEMLNELPGLVEIAKREQRMREVLGAVERLAETAANGSLHSTWLDGLALIRQLARDALAETKGESRG